MFIQTALLSVAIFLAPSAITATGESDLCLSNIQIAPTQSHRSIYVTSSFRDAPQKENFELLYKMGWPVLDTTISSGYGQRQSCSSCSTFHQGVDFTPGEGQPVLAAMRGVVSEIKDSGQYGVYIIIEHDLHNEIWHTVYAHLKRGSIPQEIFVGQSVEIGDVIGSVGRTGLATGPHLHFEIRIDGIKVNPLPLLEKYISQDN